MKIQLLITNDETNKVNKSYTTIGEVDAVLKDETAIIRPTFTVSSKDAIRCNYVFIPDFGRYYYATVSSVRQGLWRIDCKIDVLMSWRDYIYDLTGIVERQENEWNLLQQDEMFKVYQDPIVDQLAFPNQFDQEKYVITVSA